MQTLGPRFASETTADKTKAPSSAKGDAMFHRRVRGGAGGFS